MSSDALGSEILDLGKAIGLFDEGGAPQASWFDNPLHHIESIFTNDPQRTAFLRLLDGLLPPVQLADIPAHETWHPLLGNQTRGNAYLTVNTSSGVTFGFAGDFHSTESPTPLASLRAHLPLVNISGTVNAVAGTAPDPLEVSLRIHLGMAYPGDTIGLDAVVITASLAPFPTSSPTATMTVNLEGLQLDASGPQNIQLDPANLGAEAIHLIIGFIREQLSRLSGPSGEAAAVAAHLLQLLGFGSDGIPPFPFAQLSNPAALNTWFSSLLQGAGTPPVVTWLGHLVGLLGSGSIAVTGTGTESDPWVAPILDFGTATGSGLGITLASKTVSSTTSLLLGLQARVIPDGATPPVRVEGSAILASIPITGAGSAAILPSASVVAHAPGGLGAPALVSTSTITVQSIRGGFRWTGGVLHPLLELDQVDFTLGGTTTHYNQVDLSNADSVASTASSLIGATISGYLGATGPGRNLAALTGIVKPENDPASPHALDFTQLVSNPARAIAAFHRGVLLDSTHCWSFLLEEIGGLAGITTPVTGAGTRSDPWVLSLAPPSVFHIEVAAWNDQTSGVATDPQKLRIGLRASFSQSPFDFYWLAELLAFDLPQSGAGAVSLMAGQHAHMGIQPIPAIPSVAGFTLGVGDLAADMTWSPGSPLVWSAGLQNVSVAYAGNTLNIPSIGFPLAAPFDVSSPAAIAADFGLTIPDLELLFRLVLARAAYSWGGVPAFALTGLLGIHGGLDGLPADWPALADPAAAGTLLSDPFTALRNWLAQIATGVGADGIGFLPRILPWLRAMLAGALPADIGALPDFGLPISGSGTYDDPWTLPLTTTASADLDALLWLEPAGPPPGWATSLVASATGAADFAALTTVAHSVAGFVPGLGNSLANSDAGALTSALSALGSFFLSGDGVAPLSSQAPTIAGWTTFTALTSAHSAQPADPIAIQQILAQIDSLAGGAGGARSVLLIGPAFSDHTIWNPLLADPGLHGVKAPNTSFNLRVPGILPAVVDLTGVTAAASYYTADLSDDGSGDLASLSAQIGRVVARIQQLSGATPVTLVAHSTAGLAALRFANDNAALVQGIITLGTPHLGSPLPFLQDSRIGDALRVVQVLRPQIGAGPVRDALDFALTALDGYLPPATAGGLPAASPFPAGSFPAPGSATTVSAAGGKPVLAIGGQLSGSLLDVLKPALAALATSAAAPAVAPPAPTHLAFGARAHINTATTSAGRVAVDTTVRGDLFQVPLHSGAAAPPHPAHALHVRAKLTNPSGWLVGASSALVAPGLPQSDVRVRWAEIGADIYASSSGVTVDPVLQLHQVSWHGPVSPLAAFTDANAQALLGAVLQTISLPAPLPTSPAGILLATMQALNIAVVDSHGGIGISADAWSAITADAAGYLSTRFTAAINAGAGFAGFTAITAVVPGRGITAIPEWTLRLGSLPMELYLVPGPWTAGLRTISVGGAAGWPIAPRTSIELDASVTLPGFTPALDASFTLGAFTVAWTGASSQLAVSAAPWLAPLTLVPAPTAATLKAALSGALPRLLFSGIGSAVLEALAGPGIVITPLDTFFTSMSSVLTQASALGNSKGTGLDSAKLNKFLQFIAKTAGLPAGPGLSLPGGLAVTASGAGTDADPVRLQLATTAAIGGVLNLSGGVAFDKLMHPSPTGTVAFTIPLPSVWTSLTVAFGASAAGVTLSLTPVTTPATAPIQILPTFSGLGALAGAAEALLPQVLDATVTAIGPSSVANFTLQVAAALDIYDTVGGFSAHGDTLKSMLNGTWLSSFSSAQRGTIASSIAGLFSNPASPLHVPIFSTIAAGTGPNAGVVTWSWTPTGGGDSGTVTVALGWDSAGPTATVGIANLKLASGALGITATAGFAAGNVAVSADLGVHLQDAIGIDLVPTLSLRENGTNFQLEFYPLATGGGNGPITIDFIPPAIHMGAGGPVALIEQWLVPLVADTLLAAFKSEYSTPLWSGGPQLQSVLTGSHVAVPGGGGLIVNPAFPGITAVATGLLATLCNGVKLPLPGTLKVSLVNTSGRLGVRIQGNEDFPIGEYLLSMRFGAPTAWGSTFDAGVTVYLFDFSSSTFTFNPALLAAGFGLGLTGQNDGPLINTSGFRIGGVRLYSFFEWSQISGSFKLSSPGVGVEIDKLGLPLSQATGGNVGGNNPVASGLLGGGGDGGNSGGDTQPVNPAIDISAWYWSTAPSGAIPAGDGTFHILFAGSDGPIWIGIHAQLGPIYLNQIGILLNGNVSASLVLDATVKVGPLTGQVDQLGVTIPFKSLRTPGDWTLDLKGLALSFQTPGVEIAGALLKNDSGGVVEYDGMLLVKITEFGLVAVGAYSKPKDASGDYTSVFIFAGLFIVLGIPPVIEVEAIGLGVGYNRELIVPDDMNKIPDFILVAALDDGGALANDPMGELLQIRDSIPAKRGSLWLAVGLHGTTFVIVHVTAIVYVALDRGVEVGVLGVARLAIPTDDTALVSIELALKARFSSAEGILSIQAQLTSNSYLFDKDCQLTGGFAYFMWFPMGQFVITIGGYNPHFIKPTQFPDVPRLGFRWALPIGATMKGESYFALTNTAIMAGGRLEVTYGISCAYVWFTAYCDFLISWDPFYYEIDLGVSVGATFKIQICFWGFCIGVSITISLGASLMIAGPPLHGTVTVDLAICSITVAFGSNANPNPPYITDFSIFATKYLYGGDKNGNAFRVNVLSGLLPPSPSGAEPAPGTADKPWKMLSEFSFQCDTKMPATRTNDFILGPRDLSGQVHSIDLAPMNKESVDPELVVTLFGMAYGKWGQISVLNPNSNADLQTTADHWKVTPILGKVSEATWHWIDPTQIPAAANTIPAVVGIKIEGFCVFEGQTALIPIAKLYDTGNSRPLPFANDFTIGYPTYHGYGLAAELMAQATAQASSAATLGIAGSILSGGGFFAQQRVTSGFPAAGNPPVAARALRYSRSAPPMVVPITTGLTMKAPALAAPPVIVAVPPVLPVVMEQPRLRAVLRGLPQAVSDAPPTLRTTVTNVAAAAGIARMAAPLADALGARLVRVKAAAAPAATKQAKAGHTLRSSELGWASGVAHQAELANALGSLRSNGLALPAGVTHIWDLPAGVQEELIVTGDSAFRVTFLTRGGSVIADSEYPAGKQTVIAVPPRCGMVSIECLGKVPAGSAAVSPGFAAVAFSAAPAGKQTVAGWQAGNLLPQVGPTTILGRGACLMLPQTHIPLRSRQAIAQTMVRVTDAVADQIGTETWLPTSIGVVMVLLDLQDANGGANGDLSLSAQGATLSSTPIRILGGRRRALLYDVTNADPKADHIVIGVASLTGWRVSGVVGMAGKAQEWATSLQGKVPEHIVPDGPLTPDGSISVRLVAAPATNLAVLTGAAK